MFLFIVETNIGDSMSLDILFNGVLYSINKSSHKVLGSSGASLSRISGKHLIEYFQSQGLLDKDNITTDDLTNLFTEKLGFCESIKYIENNGEAIVEVVNPILKLSALQLNKENIPILISPSIMYAYVYSELNGKKAIFKNVEYSPEENIEKWHFKLINC